MTPTSNINDSGSSSSSSSSGSGSDVGVVVPPAVGEDHHPMYVGDRDRNSTGDTCGFYRVEPGQSCRRPRSCFDCLNVEIMSEINGCVLTPAGTCAHMEVYVPPLDYRINNSTVPATARLNYFPSRNTTYCEATDPACARCREIAVADGLSSRVNASASRAGANIEQETLRQFCLGQHGCVCLTACESPSWEIVTERDCGTGYTMEIHDNYRSILPIFVGIQLALIVMVVYRQRAIREAYRQQSQTFRRFGPYNNVERIQSPSNRLQLTGWREMQEQQIAREKAQHGLVNLMSPRTIEEEQASHNAIVVDDDDDDDVANRRSSLSPRNRTRRVSTDASVAMLEDPPSPVITTVRGRNQEGIVE